MATCVTRIAPTPSGYLHLGNMFNFLVIWQLYQSKKSGSDSKLLLRIDDLDTDRSRPAYLAFIDTVLDLLKIRVDQRLGSQHERLADYNRLTDTFQSKGLLYPCSCSRKELSGLKTSKISTLQRLSLADITCNCYTSGTTGHELAWRLIPEAWQEVLGMMAKALKEQPDQTIPIVPPVLIKKDGMPAYHICTIWDDFHTGCTDVVRGYDLWPSTILQKQLAHWAEMTTFANIRFYHHELLTLPDGVKLSKAAGANAYGTLPDQKTLENIVIMAEKAYRNLSNS